MFWNFLPTEHSTVQYSHTRSRRSVRRSWGLNSHWGIIHDSSAPVCCSGSRGGLKLSFLCTSGPRFTSVMCARAVAAVLEQPQHGGGWNSTHEQRRLELRGGRAGRWVVWVLNWCRFSHSDVCFLLTAHVLCIHQFLSINMCYWTVWTSRSTCSIQTALSLNQCLMMTTGEEQPLLWKLCVLVRRIWIQHSVEVGVICTM